MDSFIFTAKNLRVPKSMPGYSNYPKVKQFIVMASSPIKAYNDGIRQMTKEGFSRPDFVYDLTIERIAIEDQGCKV